MSFIGHIVNELEKKSGLLPTARLWVPTMALVPALGLILGLALGLAPAARPAWAAEPFVVAPVKKAEDLRLLPAAAWPPPESDPAEMLIKLTYLRGVLDALQYAEVAPKSSSKVLRDLSGMSLNELAAEVDRYYLADPRRRELPPAAVLFRILAAQRDQKEMSPLPGPEPRP